MQVLSEGSSYGLVRINKIVKDNVDVFKHLAATQPKVVSAACYFKQGCLVPIHFRHGFLKGHNTVRKVKKIG